MNYSARAVSFLLANKDSPVVYASVLERDGCCYRLENGKLFTLNASECRSIGHPRWRHLEAA
ncbi:MAG TPA: hypothetical protein VFH89_14425 [Sphingomicrobium sp.]|nr:hypothetical protein [Sphingomicrobium sp.]